MTVHVTGSHADRTLAISVTCEVTNTGRRPGKETVQLYVTDVHATVARPVRELRDFTKLDLAPGQSRSVTFELTARDLSYWSETMHDWVLEAGEFEFAIGSSSRNLELRSTVYVEAPRVAPPLDSMSSLDEWLTDPLGAAALRAALGTRPDGRLNGMLGDEEVVKVIGSFPMRSLAGFPNISIDHATLDSMIEQMSP
jgi:beta-glucosidase